MSKHLKRLTVPRAWSVPKKANKWVVRPSPGPHAVEGSIPLMIIIRDMLGYCKTRKEGMRIISQRQVMIDGRTITDEKYPVGLMDVVSLPKTNEHFRLVIDRNGKLRLVPIGPGEAKWKLARIEDKKVLPGRKVQLNLHDGRNLLMDKDKYKTGDVLRIELPTQRVIEDVGMGKGSMALLIGGKHVGEIVTIEDISVIKGTRENLVGFKEGFSTVKSHVFVVGKDKLMVPLP